jgi:prevent-host-death family protein
VTCDDEARSDNLICVKELSATDASRRFSDVLDAVEHRGESFSIVRHGRHVATLVPVVTPNGAAVREILARHRVDATWTQELADLRAGLVPEDRPWND